MKKLLLTMATLALGFSAYAAEVTFNFTESNYGLPAYNPDNGNDTEYVVNGASIESGNVKITFSGEKDDAWRMWSDGLRSMNKSAKNPTFTVSTLNGDPVTNVSWTVKSGVTFKEEGTTDNITEWTGSASSVTFVNTSSVNAAVETITVEYGGANNEPNEPGTPPAELIFSASLTTQESFDSFSIVETLPEGLGYVWSFGGETYGAKATGYVSGTRYDVSSWLVSPEIDLTDVSAAYFNFENALNYLSGNEATDFVGVYVGESGSTPSTTDWTNLSSQVTFGTGSNWNFMESGDVNITSFAGKKIQIGFLYSSTSEVATTWEVKNLNVYGTETGGETPDNPDEPGDETEPIFSASLTTQESFDSFDIVETLPEGLDYVWSFGGETYGAKATGYVSGTRYDVSSWLVTPEIDLTDVSAAYFNFENALNYLSGNEATDFVGVYIGESGSTPSTTGWTNLSSQVTFGTGSNWTFMESGDINITSFAGKKIQIGFLYSSTTEVAATWEVKNLNVYGTETGGETPDNPDEPGDETVWTVAEAIAQMDGGYEGQAVVKGYIYAIQEVSILYGNATYFIADSMDEDAICLEVFRGKYLEGEAFTSEDQLEIGALIVVSGKLKNYNGTYEFDSGNEILSYEAPEGGDNPGTPGDDEDVWTVAEALDQIAMGYQGEAVVEGYIVNIKEVNTEYGYATYTIADKPTFTTGLTIFRSKYLEGAPFTATNQIAVGGQVKVSGQLTIFDSTAEMVAVSLLAYTEPEGGNPEVPGDVVSLNVSYNLKDEAVYKTFTVDNANLPSGLEYIWSYDSRYGAKGSAFKDNTNFEADSWLISPELDFTNLTEASMNFSQAINYLKGNDPTEFCGVYVGESGTNSSTWTSVSDQVSYPENDGWDFVPSGEIDLTDFVGKKVKIGFLYSSTSTAAQTWEIESLTVTGTGMATGAVEEVGVEINDAPVEYYTLQGIRVNNPVKGQLYIIRQGKKVTKAVIR